MAESKMKPVKAWAVVSERTGTKFGDLKRTKGDAIRFHRYVCTNLADSDFRIARVEIREITR